MAYIGRDEYGEANHKDDNNTQIESDTDASVSLLLGSLGPPCHDGQDEGRNDTDEADEGLTAADRCTGREYERACRQLHTVWLFRRRH